MRFADASLSTLSDAVDFTRTGEFSEREIEGERETDIYIYIEHISGEREIETGTENNTRGK